MRRTSASTSGGSFDGRSTASGASVATDWVRACLGACKAFLANPRSSEAAPCPLGVCDETPASACVERQPALREPVGGKAAATVCLTADSVRVEGSQRAEVESARAAYVHEAVSTS